MKQCYLFALSLFLASISLAQKGSWLVGGDLTLSDMHGPNAIPGFPKSTTNFTVMPTVGYQFTHAWTLGIVGGITHTDEAGLTPDNAWFVGPFIRYTRPLTTWVSVYGQFQAVYNDEGRYDVNTNGSTHLYQYEGVFFPALLFHVKNGFGINLSLGGIKYGNEYLEGNSKALDHYVNLTFGNTVQIGVSENFGGH
jgi:hypothetical protein